TTPLVGSTFDPRLALGRCHAHILGVGPSAGATPISPCKTLTFIRHLALTYYPEGGILIRGSTFRRAFPHPGDLFADSTLVASDFKAPVRGRRRAQLDELFRREIFTPGVIGTRLVNRGGTITYAARHQLIGTKVPYMRDLAGVFAGISKRRVTHTVSWRGDRNVKVLQSLVPVRESATTKPVGACEFDQDHRAL